MYRLVVVLLVCFSMSFVFAGDAVYETLHVNALEAGQIINEKPELQVLDVRTPREFDEGHLDGAINIDYHAGDFAERVKLLDPDLVYLVHCRSGVRSGKALSILRGAGLNRLVHLDGGINAWLTQGLPTVK